MILPVLVKMGGEGGQHVDAGDGERAGYKSEGVITKAVAKRSCCNWMLVSEERGKL